MTYAFMPPGGRSDIAEPAKPGLRPGLGQRLRSWRLTGFAALLLLLIAVVQFMASILFYGAIDRQSVREDHARRIAELLVVGDRLHRRDAAHTAAIMSTHHLNAVIAPAPTVARQGAGEEVTEIDRQISLWEPELAHHKLFLTVTKGSQGRRDLAGSMQLHDGSWLNFRSPDLSAGWPIALRATLMTLIITLLSLGLGLWALNRMLGPLRLLSMAADAIAHGQPTRVPESGPADLRTLARTLNNVQARITDLESDQARSFEAISHDLRTPISRLKIASDFLSDSDIAKIVNNSADEMEAMLMSLQSFLRAQHLSAEAEETDLAALCRDVAAAHAGPVTLVAPAEALAVTYREPLELALRPLVENAVQHGDTVTLRLMSDGADWAIEVEDDGPGIAEEHFDAILDPFFRLDDARGRDTPGFGLGIPSAHRLITRFGGTLTFRNAAKGGLIARLGVPRG